MSAFHIWNPCVTNDSNVEFIVTNGDVVDGVFKGTDFCENLLKSLGAERRVEEWSITAYQTQYYSEYLDSDDWRDVWQIVWKVALRTDSRFDIFEPSKFPWHETNAAGGVWVDAPEEDSPVRCLVIADFDTSVELEQVKTAIANDAFADIRAKSVVDVPSFRFSEVLALYKQLQIDLGTFEPRFFAEGADYARQVMDLCHHAGGTTHYEARL